MHWVHGKADVFYFRGSGLESGLSDPRGTFNLNQHVKILQQMLVFRFGAQFILLLLVPHASSPKDSHFSSCIRL